MNNCVGISKAKYISEPKMTVMDHLINLGIMIAAAKRCKCKQCRSTGVFSKDGLMAGELGRMAVKVETARRNEPVKVFMGLVERWSADRIAAEFGD
jgi:hypothetical protein